MTNSRLPHFLAVAERTLQAYGDELVDEHGNLDVRALEIIAMVALNAVHRLADEERLGEAVVRVIRGVLGPQSVTFLGQTTETPQ